MMPGGDSEVISPSRYIMIDVKEDVFGNSMELMHLVDNIDKDTPVGVIELKPLPKRIGKLKPTRDQTVAFVEQHRAALEKAISEAVNETTAALAKADLESSNTHLLDPILAVGQRMLKSQGASFVRQG